MNDHRVDEPEAPPSVLEELFRKSQLFVEGLVAERVKASVDRVLERTFRRVILYLIAAAFFATAVVFLLVAGTEGMKQAGAPAWSAYLLPGVLGGFAGMLLLQRLECRRHK